MPRFDAEDMPDDELSRHYSRASIVNYVREKTGDVFLLGALTLAAFWSTLKVPALYGATLVVFGASLATYALKSYYGGGWFRSAADALPWGEARYPPLDEVAEELHSRWESEDDEE